VEQHPVEELIANLRRVSMLTRPDVYPYSNAGVIDTIVLSTDDIAPAQRYVLKDEFEKVRDLRWALKEHDVDLFKLGGYVTIWVEGFDEPIDVLPPVVEESKEANGLTVSVLNDGMHRVYLARTCWSPIEVVRIMGIPDEFPYYAYPLVDGWRDVEIIDELKKGMLKKFHRTPNNKELYRNFDSAFNNVGGPRKAA
jgi:hypothetical protein